MVSGQVCASPLAAKERVAITGRDNMVVVRCRVEESRGRKLLSVPTFIRFEYGWYPVARHPYTRSLAGLPSGTRDRAKNVLRCDALGKVNVHHDVDLRRVRGEDRQGEDKLFGKRQLTSLQSSFV